MDPAGHVYVADCRGNNGRVVKVAPDGTQTTNGSRRGAPNAPGPPVWRWTITENVCVGDHGNNRVVKVAPDPAETTIASGFTLPLLLLTLQAMRSTWSPGCSGGLGR